MMNPLHSDAKRLEQNVKGYTSALERCATAEEARSAYSWERGQKNVEKELWEDVGSILAAWERGLSAKDTEVYRDVQS